MHDVGLCMTVKDEALNIRECLGPIHDRFARIVVIDTGSTDDTVPILRNEFGIEPLLRPIEDSPCCALSLARNEGFDQLETPWLMTLDADERIDPSELDAVLKLDDATLPAGLFCRWTTHFPGRPPIEDYKLALFRNPYRHMGLVHDTAQPSLRADGARAEWTALMTLHHYPKPSLAQFKAEYYAWRLECALEREPDWQRYRWFRGHQAWCTDPDQDLADLRALHAMRPPQFPVESLNASKILLAQAAARGDAPAVLSLADEALEYHRSVADDFEVAVNFRLRPWFEAATLATRAGDIAGIVPYRFPY